MITIAPPADFLEKRQLLRKDRHHKHANKLEDKILLSSNNNSNELNIVSAIRIFADKGPNDVHCNPPSKGALDN